MPSVYRKVNPSTAHNSTPEIQDSITLLRPQIFSGKTLTFKDGRWHKEAAADAKTWQRETHIVRGVDDLFARVRKGPNKILIHGAPLDSTPETCLRRNVFFAEQALHLIVLDIDKHATAATSLGAAAREYRALLSAEFHGASCIAQASSGFNTAPGVQSFRLYFFADTPLTKNQKVAWLSSVAPLGADGKKSTLDASVWRRVQPVFLANPRVMGGKDPCAERWIKLDGEPCVRTPESLPEPVLPKTEARAQTAPEGVVVNAAHSIWAALDTLKGRDADRILRDGRHVTCMTAAMDFHDRAIEPALTEALILAWAQPCEEHDELPRDLMAAAGLSNSDVDALAQRAAHLGGALQAEGDPLAETDDFTIDDISRMVADGFNSAQGAFGCRYEKKTTGEALGAVDAEDGALPIGRALEKERRARHRVRAAFGDLQAACANFDDPDAEPPTLAAQSLAAVLTSDNRFDADTRAAAIELADQLAFNPKEPESRLERLREIIEDGVLGQGEESDSKPKKRRIKNAAEFIAEYAPIEFVVDQILPRGRTYTLTAPTTHGKTTVMAAMALAIATGRQDILGLEIAQGRVLYCAFETPDDFRVKLAAAAECLEISHEILGANVEIIDEIVTPEEIRRLAKERGPFKAAFVDTLAASYQGPDSNSNDEMKRHMLALRKISNLPGNPAVLIGAHPKKSPDKNELIPYGGGSLVNETDGNLTLWKPRGTRIAELGWTKLRAAAFEPIKLELVDYESRLVDTKGRRLRVPVARPMSAEAADKARVQEEREALADDARLLHAIKRDPRGSMEALGQSVGMSRGGVRKRFDKLVSQGLVAKIDGAHRLTDAGEAHLADALHAAGRCFEPVPEDDD